MNFKELLSPLQEIALKASQAILEIYRDEDRFEVQHKADNSPLTAADQAANDLICRHLEKWWSFPIISEENKLIPYRDRRTYDYCWLVDPLDGTKEFINRNDEFTVNIALLRGTEPVAGMIHLPVTGETYFGAKDGGAVRISGGDEHPLQCRTFDHQATALNFLCSRSHLNDATRRYIERYDAPHFLPRGSSLKFLEIAKGNADIYPRLGPTMEWDTAAAQVILEEAGGHILEWETREPLHYNKQDLLNPNFIAFGVGAVK